MKPFDIEAMTVWYPRQTNISSVVVHPQSKDPVLVGLIQIVARNIPCELSRTSDHIPIDVLQQLFITLQHV